MGQNVKWVPLGTTGGLVKAIENPVLGPEYGTTFDIHVIKEEHKYRMWFSWRDVRLIAHTISDDGIHWDLPRAVLTAIPGSEWEGDEVNRSTIVVKDGLYHMWYTGQVFARENQMSKSCIGYAVSEDGVNWMRREEPVLVPEEHWERYCVMCPHVLWDDEDNIFKMWYSAGHMHESDAIGYAESPDGINWIRYSGNPVFMPDPNNYWDMSKVEACFVMKWDGWYYMFYMGVHGDYKSAVGLARSKDGLLWERHPDNPIIAGDDDLWDFGGICKVSVVEEENGFRLWYNASNGGGEQIGTAFHRGFSLFPDVGNKYVSERGENPCRKGKFNYYYNRFALLRD